MTQADVALASLLDLIQLLRRHRRPVSGRRLADELRVSIRTLYRDIVTFQGQGAPIMSARASEAVKAP